MIDHLKRGAKRIAGWPRVIVITVNIQNKAADRIRRVAAVIHQIVPVGIAQLRYIAAEGFEQIEPMLRGQISLVQYPLKRLRFQRGFALAEAANPASPPAAQAFRLAALAHDRRHRRLRAQIGKTPGSPGDGICRSGTTRRENSRPCGPCRRKARRCPASLSGHSLRSAFPHAAAPAPMLNRRVHGEHSIAGTGRRK